MAKAAAHNPKGHNSKAKPCHQERDKTVINIATRKNPPAQKS
ncbi:hypothetical protein [Aestuariicoccus sp. MJ-SS9]|nr:hypothetical protein [Aestuariicoccus sp. MJ-SS9]MDU8911430.1 hypothetical protein [Aestuariicoccus sp. MJ-SS9]